MPKVNINFRYDHECEDECPHCGTMDTYIDKNYNVRCSDCNQILEFTSIKQQPTYKIKKFKDEK
jgi:hypothetical protein